MHCVHDNPSEKPGRFGLVLMGGGARTAYQVGVLHGVSRILAADAPAAGFPFKVLVGTSAGALNSAFLGANACEGLRAFDALVKFWRELRSAHVYCLELPRWRFAPRLLAAMTVWRQARLRGAVLDTMPLVDTLHRAISLDGIDRSLDTNSIDALAVTASSYSSGVHWTFVQAANERAAGMWTRPGRRSLLQPLTIEHLMASAAIPFLFPATPLWVDGAREYFGDGSMRQTAPLAPAIHLGADRILAVGVGRPQRAAFGAAIQAPNRSPTFSRIAGHTLATVFHDTLQGDVEQAKRFNQMLGLLDKKEVERLGYRHVDVLAFQPSQSIDELARGCIDELPFHLRRALGGTAALRAGAAIPSYLLFEPAFVDRLMELGSNDAFARREEIERFFRPSRQLASGLATTATV